MAIISGGKDKQKSKNKQTKLLGLVLLYYLGFQFRVLTCISNEYTSMYVHIGASFMRLISVICYVLSPLQSRCYFMKSSRSLFPFLVPSKKVIACSKQYAIGFDTITAFITWAI